ncbi:MAG: hypothetical protein K2R98_30435 [Gemmataceae bacterium]|nr:hypothetical protein [Gemmataceae bacterium]
MSTTPGTNPAQNNKNLFLMVGLFGGLVFLCGGMFVMAITTLQIVGKNATATFAMNETRPRGPGQTKSSGGGESDVAGATRVANSFIEDVIASKISDAYQKTSETFQGQYSTEEFRKHIEDMKGFRGASKGTMTLLRGQGADGELHFRGTVNMNTGIGRFELTVKEDDSGTWKVTSFEKK